MAVQFIGVGVGPGDPELITLKAARLIEEADVICFITNENDQSQAKNIARYVLGTCERKAEIPIVMPMCENRSIANRLYDKAAEEIQQVIEAGKTVVFLCEGDPLFFGSFAYLLERLKNVVSCQVVPGISSVHASSAALLQPLTMLKESFCVVSGRHDESVLIAALNSHDSVVIMKAGRSRQRILSALKAANRTQDAQYLEYIGREGEVIENNISLLKEEGGPYFSLFVVTRKERDFC
ncbi:MAG: precorrin-2 C(20)-methyltransferase [Pseudomonadales bacterium]|nr:precorrin-2 C(20)-methyltransferase [Pseudomonadales bacterium]